MSADERRAPLRRAALGCAGAVFLAPLGGLLAWQVGGFAAGLVVWGLGAVALAGWSALNLWRVPPGPGRTGIGQLPRWSFNPRSAALLAGTDVLATGGDASALVTGGLGYVLVFFVAMLTAGLVLFSEYHECRRPGHAFAKALAAFALVIVPTPVAGLVGASVSLGDRLLVAPREQGSGPGGGSPRV